MAGNPYGPEWDRISQQIRVISEAHRKLMEPLARQQELVRSATAGFASIDVSALQKQVAAIQRTFSLPQAQMNAIAASLDMAAALNPRERARISDFVRNTPIDTAADPEDALEEVAANIGVEAELENPSGFTAFLDAVALLSPAMVREFKFRLLSLLVATAMFLQALDLEQSEDLAGANVLVQCYGLYASLIKAIDEIKREPSEHSDP